jgi:hypothetical protein
MKFSKSILVFILPYFINTSCYNHSQGAGPSGLCCHFR